MKTELLYRQDVCQTEFSAQVLGCEEYKDRFAVELDRKIHMKGFRFAKQEKAFTKLFAGEADAVYGDSFERKGTASAVSVITLLWYLRVWILEILR